ncbi:MAG: hypothetical protein JXA11_15555 [Phycisphaerae bacterium]|nr:hypothetical protein [Phycisphaerae bacterium]
MNRESNQFEQSLSDSLEAISKSAPAAPDADAIFRRLRRRKARRISGAVTVLVLLACGLGLLVSYPFHHHVSSIPSQVVHAPASPSEVQAKSAQPWTPPKLTFSAVSLPDMKLQGSQTANMPTACAPSGATGTSPRIQLRFAAPSVSLPKL